MHTAGAAANAGSVGDRLDALPFNRLHLVLFAVLGLGLMFDQMDGSMSSVLTAVFAEPGSGVSGEAMATMLTVYYVVAAVGGPAMGALSDRIGRRAALLIALIGFGALTIGAVAMPDFSGFAVFRVASSFFLSAVPPLVFSYIADTMPPRVRGVAMMLITILSALGATLAPAVTHLGNDRRPFGFTGWETALLVAGAAGILVALLMARLVESPRWLFARGRLAEAEKATRAFETSRAIRCHEPAAAVPKPAVAGSAAAQAATSATLGQHRRPLSVIVLIMFLQSAGLTGFALLLTKALIMKGMTMQAALGSSSIILLAMPFGVIAFAVVTDRMDRRTLFAGMSVILGLSAIAFGFARSETLLLAAGLVFALLLTAHSAVSQIYCAEMFPTAIRGAAMGFGYAAVRAGSDIVPAVMLPLLLARGPAAAFAVIGGLLLASALIVRLFGPSIKPGTHLA